MTTSDRIRQRRLELGLTQLEVAKRIGLTTKAAVCKIEKQGNDVTLKNVERFAKALNCSPAYLMGWEEENENNTQIDKLDIQADFPYRNHFFLIPLLLHCLNLAYLPFDNPQQQVLYKPLPN